MQSLEAFHELQFPTEHAGIDTTLYWINPQVCMPQSPSLKWAATRITKSRCTSSDSKWDRDEPIPVRKAATGILSWLINGPQQTHSVIQRKDYCFAWLRKAEKIQTLRKHHRDRRAVWGLVLSKERAAVHLLIPPDVPTASTLQSFICWSVVTSYWALLTKLL